MPVKESKLSFTIKKIDKTTCKFYYVENAVFFKDYYAYKDAVLKNDGGIDIKWNPITLASFNAAKQLKSKYDSVIWLAYLNNKTFFYVVKGKWDMYKDLEPFFKKRHKDSVIEPYKMGLVNSEFKEVIPPKYDLIHNIGGTIAGLIEVEKDKKRGFYNLSGKNVVPISYDQIYPIDDENNLAVLKDSDSFYFLKNDTTISGKIDLKIQDFFSKIKYLQNSADLRSDALSVITEYNSRKENGAIYLPPSYLVDLKMIEKVLDFKNPLRIGDYVSVHSKFELKSKEKSEEPNNWFTATFYYIRDYFLGGRSEFYDTKNIVIIDKRTNKLFTKDLRVNYVRGEFEETESLDGVCDVNSIRAINDTLLEVKAGAVFSVELYDSTKAVVGGPYYHYLSIKNGELKELPDRRNFGFTKYVKMDDSYLIGCYVLLNGRGRYDERTKENLAYVTPEMLRYIKNEIYAEYNYKFKDKRWIEIFASPESDNTDLKGNPIEIKKYANVENYLTEIDKYNINWINEKLKASGSKSNTLAAK
jgi:hypothetical protein